MKNKEEKLEKKVKKNYKKYLVFVIFFVVVILTNIVTYKLVGSKNTILDLNKFPLLNPISTIVDQKDMIVSIQPLRDDINAFEADNPDISIYFEFLNTGANITVNKDAEFFPASLSKLPLVMTAVKKIERGEWKWENELVIMPMDKDDRFGELYKQPIGTKMTIEALIKEMLINSDDTAYTMILRNLEPDEFKTTQQKLGLDSFFSSEGKISANNYVVILRSLYNSSYLKLEDSEKLIKMMADSTTNEFLSKGLPSDVTFSHKVGISKEDNVYLDAGIVYLPERPYFLVVMINSKDEEQVKKDMKYISEMVYNYISSYNKED